MAESWDELPVPPRSDKPSPEVAAALAVLEAACETSAPASLMAAHMALSCAGRLRAASYDGVVVELSRPPPDPLLPGAACALSFPVAGRSAGFTGRATAVEDGPRGSLLVTLEVPTRIQHKEQRSSVRIPVPDGTLSVAILRGESLDMVRAVDISLHGMLVEVDTDDGPELAEGHRRMMALKLEGKTLVIEGEVRRRDGPRFGMLFVIRDKPPRDLVRMIRRLQQLWFAL